ncbi:hypothetical protein G7054_g13719 [Neopestalotiopsis clavispora]|nr:hypothetical protein G7054_g13719 [Neopestalotiopsis clavispora]
MAPLSAGILAPTGGATKPSIWALNVLPTDMIFNFRCSLHGYSHENPRDMTIEQQEIVLDKTYRLITEFCEKPGRGFVVPWWETSKEGADLMLKYAIRIHAATQGNVKARLRLTETHVNSSGGIRGSLSATIVDWTGGMAIATWDLRDKTDVSVDIHIRYLSSAGEDEVI